MTEPRTYDRPLTEDDRALLAHVGRWGSNGYPIRKLKGSGTPKWTWEYRSLSAPVLYTTKREAVAAFEAYLNVLVDCAGAEAERQTQKGGQADDH